MRKYCWLWIVACFFIQPLSAQNKILKAAKTEQVPRIDGDLNDPAWINAPVADQFIQNFPSFGTASSNKTSVKLLYDDAAIYIGAYLYDDPTLIRKQLTVRDGEQRQDVDYFSVFFDTYNDDQNGFQFLVTSANVQSDARMGSNLDLDFGEYGDKTWEAVWESKVSMRADGWIVEMRIPYISLRFSKNSKQTWGLNFLRHTRRTNETSFWNPVNPSVNGFVNQFGDLESLENIQPPLRLSFSPYLSAGFRSIPRQSTFKSEFLRSGGMDVKYGINESFTLDATLIPDFGQVVSDNVINNLSPFEVRFTENRPFFTEGTELFNKAGLFYSRRVGATPSKYGEIRNFADTSSTYDLIKNPTLTQLYNAVKFSGRNQKNFGFGVFNAVTAPAQARLRNRNTGVDSVVTTEALANYNIIVVDKAFKGQNFITFTNTNVLRKGRDRDANVTGINYALYSKKNVFGTTGAFQYSRIFGLNSYDGFNASLRAGKVSGNWQYHVLGSIISNKFDPRDLGFLTNNNEVITRAGVSYQIFQPTEKFITYVYELIAQRVQLYRPGKYARTDLAFNNLWVFKNFWDVSFNLLYNPGAWYDYFELQQAPDHFLSFPGNYSVNMSGSTDSRKRAFVSFGGSFARLPALNTNSLAYQLGLRYRFSNRFTFSGSVDALYSTNNRGYAFLTNSLGDPLAATRDIRQLSTLFSGVYNFTPRMNLTMRMRHYWSRVNFKEILSVNPDGTVNPFVNTADIHPYISNPNFFNIDAFLTWDFRLGSRIILGWKNWLGEEEMVDSNKYKNYLRNASRVLQLPHGNELTLRVIYFLDYNQFRKKR